MSASLCTRLPSAWLLDGKTGGRHPKNGKPSISIRSQALEHFAAQSQALKRLTTDLGPMFLTRIPINLHVSLQGAVARSKAVRSKALQRLARPAVRSKALQRLARPATTAPDALGDFQVEPSQVDHPRNPPASPVPQQGNPSLSRGVSSGTAPRTTPLGVPAPGSIGSDPPQ